MTRGAGTAPLRYAALLAARDRGVLAPLLALLLLLLGVYAYRPNDVQGTWALTAAAVGARRGLAADRRGAAPSPTPSAWSAWPPRAAAGRRGAATRQVELALAGLVVALLLAYPLATGAFDRAVTAGDLAAAASAHAACALAGAALGRLASPPVTGRAATSLVLVLGATLASVAAAGAARPARRPGSAWRTRSRPRRRAPSRRGLLAAEAACLALAGAVRGRRAARGAPCGLSASARLRA